jgi:hypothetical protein
MSDAKAPKKIETAPKKVEAAKPAVTKIETAKPDTAKSETTASEATAADSSAKKAEPTAKSASQESISHFSSVSTPEYRSGWDKIFGVGKDSEKTISNNANDRELPNKLILMDSDINTELRNLLDEEFDLLAKNNGMDLDVIKKTAALKYSIYCHII